MCEYEYTWHKESGKCIRINCGKTTVLQIIVEVGVG